MITEYLTNPTVAIVTGVATVGTNAFIIALPTIINVLMAAYLLFLVIHKGIQLYREFKKKDEPSQ